MKVLCSKCKTPFNSNQSVCPECGSADRFIAVEDSFAPYESRVGVKNKLLYSGKHKFFAEMVTNPDFDRDTQQDTMVTRQFDRRKEYVSLDGSYIEKILTRSGELLKIYVGKLSEHQGHGNDRKNQRHNP